jgi:hypothetical protein
MRALSPMSLLRNTSFTKRFGRLSRMRSIGDGNILILPQRHGRGMGRCTNYSDVS